MVQLHRPLQFQFDKMRNRIQIPRVGKAGSAASQFSMSVIWREAHSCRTTLPGMDSMNEAYAEYLASDEWKQRRKQRILESDGKCEACGTTLDLQVHHLTYDRIFHEPMRDLMALCNYHHAAAEEAVKEKIILRKGDVEFLRRETIRALFSYGHSPARTKFVPVKIQDPDTPINGFVVLTNKLLRDTASNKCGWTCAQLQCLGVFCPPKKGWLRRLIGKQIAKSDWEQFLALSAERKARITHPKIRMNIVNNLPEGQLNDSSIVYCGAKVKKSNGGTAELGYGTFAVCAVSVEDAIHKARQKAIALTGELDVIEITLGSNA